MPAESVPTFYYITHLCEIELRALIRAGATGARAPAEFWQWVKGTRPDKGAILVNSKKVLQNLR